MNELALFAGAGGGILGGHLLGWKTVAACEIEDYPREALLRRQIDGLLPRFPIWDDIRTFDGKPFRGKIDIITGGFPCQDISAAGRGVGITGERSGLWKEMHRIISEVRPRFAFMENSPLLSSRGLGPVLGDLAEIGYDAEWCVLGADDVGGAHTRKRIWILAIANNQSEYVEEPKMVQQEKSNGKLRRDTGNLSGKIWTSKWKTCEPSMVGTSNDVADWVGSAKAIGNGQVPAVAAVAFLALSKRLFEDGNE